MLSISAWLGSIFVPPWLYSNQLSGLPQFGLSILLRLASSKILSSGANLLFGDSIVRMRRLLFFIIISLASESYPGAINASMNNGSIACTVSTSTGSLKQIIEPNADSGSLAVRLHKLQLEF